MILQNHDSHNLFLLFYIFIKLIFYYDTLIFIKSVNLIEVINGRTFITQVIVI